MLNLNVIALKFVQFCPPFPNRMLNIPAVSPKTSRKILRILKLHCKMKKNLRNIKEFQTRSKDQSWKSRTFLSFDFNLLIALESFEVFQSSQTLPYPFRTSFSCIKAQFADEYCKRLVAIRVVFITIKKQKVLLMW